MSKGEEWIEKFRQHLRDHRGEFQRHQGPPSVWFDGFTDVLLLGHSSHPDDNPYCPEIEEEIAHFQAYRAGAKAAESLLRTLRLDES